MYAVRRYFIVDNLVKVTRYLQVYGKLGTFHYLVYEIESIQFTKKKFEKKINK